MKTQNWSISITSFANKNSLTNEQIVKLLDIFNDEEYQDFLSTQKESDKKYDSYPTAKWQLEKAREIEKTFFDKLTHNINNTVDVSVNLEINFPNDFDKDDVLIWVESLDRLLKIHPMVKQKEIIQKVYVENLAKQEHIFLKELVNNQKIKIQKI